MDEPSHIQTLRYPWTVWVWATLMVVLVASGTIWLTPPTHTAHLDGASYLAGAESIGTGRGYRMISAIGAPPITTYPPLHSALLSWVWRIQPEYPANLEWLHASMLVVGLLALVLVYFEWIRRGVPPWLAAVTGVVLGWSGCWQMLTTFYMAEPIFLVLVAAMAGWWWRRPDDSGLDWRAARWWLGLGFLAALMYLTRSAAAGIIAGILVAGVWSGGLRRGRNLAGFALPLGAAVALWALQPKSAQGGYLAYLVSRWEELGGSSGAAGLALSQVWDHLGGHSLIGLLSDASERIPNAQTLQSYSIGPALRGVQVFVALGMMALAVHGYRVGRLRGDAGVLTVIGFYLLQLFVWPFAMGSRAAIFLLPWVVPWVWRGWTNLGWVARRPALRLWVPATVLAGTAASNLLFARMTLNSTLEREAAEIATVGRWIRDHVPGSEIVGATVGVSGFDLYHAANRKLLNGPGGAPAPRYDPIPQDSSLRATFLVVQGGSPFLQEADWELRLEHGNLRVLARRTPGNNGPTETHR